MKKVILAVVVVVMLAGVSFAGEWKAADLQSVSGRDVEISWLSYAFHYCVMIGPALDQGGVTYAAKELRDGTIDVGGKGIKDNGFYKEVRRLIAEKESITEYQQFVIISLTRIN